MTNKELMNKLTKLRTQNFIESKKKAFEKDIISHHQIKSDKIN